MCQMLRVSTASKVPSLIHNLLGDKVKEVLTEVKMSGIRKASGAANQKKTYQRKDGVTVLGPVYGVLSIVGLTINNN
jgi:hypothetical protein